MERLAEVTDASDFEVDDAVLLQRAAEGERLAAGELLARRMPMLAAMARRITVPSIDPDDLLAEAITQLLSKWAEGKGPHSGIDTYVIRSMRNRVVDEIRSPRFRTTTVDVMPEPVPVVQVEFEHVELHREFSLVQAALERLPADQRRVLQATVVDGRKPAELVGELGRSAGAVYSLQLRAKHGLQRSLLQVILEQSDAPACRQCARELPKTITPELIDDSGSSAAAHLRTCKDCSRGWQRYLLLMAFGGAACVILVGALLVVPAAPAAAAVAVGSSSADVNPPADRKQSKRTRRPTLRTLLGMAAVLTGVTLTGWAASGGHAVTEQLGTMSMVVTSPASERTDVSITFNVAGRSWKVDELTLTLPAGEALTSTPSGWSCRPTRPDEVSCTVAVQNPTGGTLSFEGPAAGKGTYTLAVKATSGRDPVTGTTTVTNHR